MKALATLMTVVGTLIIVATLLMCLIVIIPPFAGYRVFNVASGSMEPEIPVGSLVFVEEVSPTTLLSDDVITFVRAEGPAVSANSEAGTVAGGSGVAVTHRVVENNVSIRQLVTKGDANSSNDLYPVSYEDVVGRMEFSVPVLGNVADGLSTLAGKMAAVVLVVVGLLLCIVASRIKKKAEQPKMQVIYF